MASSSKRPLQFVASTPLDLGDVVSGLEENILTATFTNEQEEPVYVASASSNGSVVTVEMSDGTAFELSVSKRTS